MEYEDEILKSLLDNPDFMKKFENTINTMMLKYSIDLEIVDEVKKEKNKKKYS